MWLTVLVLVVLLMVPLYVAFRLGWVADLGGRGNADAEWLRYQPAAGDHVVMGVGSSLLQAGIVRADLAADSQTQWLLFNRGGANFQNFRAMLQSQWRVQPEVLIVQTDLFLKEDTSDRKVFLASLRPMFMFAVRWVLGWSPPQSNDDLVFPAEPLGGLSERGRLLSDVYRSHPTQQVQMIEWLKLQQTRGSQVVLLDIPRSPSVEKAIGAPLVRWRADMQVIAKQLQVPLLHYGFPLNDADFYDGSHMGPSGRKVHTRWLQQKIKELQHESP